MTRKSKNSTQIKVLNIAQPNAHYVMFSGKNVENRSMISNYRGTIAIYASATYQKKRFEEQKITKDECSFGMIIGFVDIVDCITEKELTRKTKKWFHGPYGYLFENVRVLKNPVKVKPPQGAIIWWTLEGKQATECLNQVPLKSIIPIEKVQANKSKPKAKTTRSIMVPSKELAVIIGNKPIKLMKAIELIYYYLEDRDLLTDKIKGSTYFQTDNKLKKIFKSKMVNLKDIRKLLLEHLYLKEK